jgi:hypothetical protein
MIFLLLIGVNLFWSILCEVVEYFGVGIHRLVALLRIHELSMLAFYDVCWNILCMEGFLKLGLLYLVSGASGGEVGPPCSGIA